MSSDVAMEPPLNDGPNGASPRPSSFFHTPATAQLGSLAILHLKRDASIPVILRDTADDGYAEGAVINTRFGSFPHSTLLDVEWGSQVRASKVDTGSRGRRLNNGAAPDSLSSDATPESAAGAVKRKAANPSDETQSDPPAKRVKTGPADARTSAPSHTLPVQAGSGFLHVLPPTPEAWTSSLDHRTQVVYIPDYSYILQRLQVRPGDCIIEAGAGSGSFTHAAARAVFDGYPDAPAEKLGGNRQRHGRVCSFEYHAPRVATLSKELDEQRLDGVVTLTHRDVCNDGFLLQGTDMAGSSPHANAVFLDLPAPWLALRHLVRGPGSPLDPHTTVHLCTFSPCIEQVIMTVSHLRKTGWTEIEMVEVAQRRLDVRREQVGLRHEGLRGVNAAPATVQEAVARLRDVENKLSDYHANKTRGADDKKKIQTKQERLEEIRRDVSTRRPYKEGNLVHRTESEVKTHTSYLVFAMLPKDWTVEDEKACEDQWPVEQTVSGEKA